MNTMLRPPFDPEAMPASMRRLPLSSKGYPVPWFVDRRAPKRGEDFDFRIMDGDKLKLAIREKRCWVCGGKITGIPVFVAGPMCGINRNSAEPPCHEACAFWSVRACPFLAVPKRIRDEADMPANKQVAGMGITRNPGVSMLWASVTYKAWRPKAGGWLFDIGDPIKVAWFAQGREATREEVVESIEGGLPLLMAEAAKGGAADCFELGRMTERFLRYLPAAA